MAEASEPVDSLLRPIDPAAPLVCLMGNSHIQAFRDALRTNPAPFDDVTVDLFSGSLVAWQRMTIAEDAFVTGHPAQRQRWTRQPPHKSQIKAADYDAFILFGFGIQYIFALRTLVTMDVYPAKSPRLISRPAIRAMIREIFTDSFAHFVICNLLKMTDAPITLFTTPLPAETLLERPQYNCLKDEGGAEVVAAARFYTEECVHDLFGDDVQVILPDAGLLGETGLTQSHLLRNGGKVLDGIEMHQDGYDHVHMNDAYARFMLDRSAPALLEMLPGRR